MSARNAPLPPSLRPGSPALAECRRRLRRAQALLHAKPAGPREVGRVMVQVMAEVQAAEQEQDWFIRATATDLLNGLAVIRGRAQLLQQRAAKTDRVDAADLEAGLMVVVTVVDNLVLELTGLIDEIGRLPADPDEDD